MIELGLKRIAQLIKDTPLRWKAIHIAGTNGKGSTAAYLSALLHQQGVSVGRFTSPHLIDRWDCISVKEKTVRKDLFKFIESEVKARNYGRGIQATEFELLTATAFELFNQQGVSVGVIECGMGGRLDATNVLEPSDVLVSIITKIGLDHQNLLGSTLQEITTEKAGIMKKGVPIVVDGTNVAEVKEVLRQQAEKVFNPPYFETSPSNPASLEKYGLPRVDDGMVLAPHQQSNLILALSAFEAARRNRSRLEIAKEPAYSSVLRLKPESNPDTEQRKWTGSRLDWCRKIDLPSVIQHVQNSHPGRLQWLSIRPITGRKGRVLLDGAHNLSSVQALSAYVTGTIRESETTNQIGKRPITWVIAMSKGKDVLELLKPLIRHGDNLVATRFGPVDGMPWVESEDPEKIRAAADSIVRPIDDRVKKRAGFMKAYEHVWSALGKASALAGKDGPLVITGSLYLVSDVLRMLRDPPESHERKSQDAWVEQQRAQLEKRKRGIFDDEDERDFFQREPGSATGSGTATEIASRPHERRSVA
jgi:dihydrofolate synthase